MPTVFTHALVAGACARAAPRTTSRWKTGLVFAGAAVAPDLDVAAFALGIPYEHALGHRGFFHSLPFALLLVLVLTLLVFREIPRFSPGWWLHLAAAFLAVASHGLLDAATDAGLGIGLLVPFSQERYFFPFRPIETSSVNPFVFFRQGRSLDILLSELLWIWIPMALLSLAYLWGRFLGKKATR